MRPHARFALLALSSAERLYLRAGD